MLSARDVLVLHAAVARYLGRPPGVADVAALRQALAAPDGVAGADLFEQAAALAAGLAVRRPYIAANTALAVAAAAFFLRAYDLELQLSVDEMPELRAVLDSGDASALAGWLRAHTVPLPLENRG